jgi:phage terminase large subunit-like protein
MVPAHYIKTKADELAVAQGCYFDHEAAERVAHFFETFLTLSAGPNANQPFRLLPWQRDDIIFPLFGWKQADGRRRFTRCLITTGKKVGKSVLVAGLGLALLLIDKVESPLVVLGACTREQAAELYKECTFSIRHNNKLRDILHTVPSQKYLTYPKKNGTLKAISWDSPGKGGWNCSAVILDEMALHKDASLYEMLKSSMIARAEPLLIMLSNAGYDKQHYYYSIYQHAKAILDGDSTDTTFLPVIYEVPEEADWKDAKNWPLANPSLGTVLSPDSFREDFEDAQRNKAGEMHFRRFRCNQWTAKKDAWLDLDDWDRCKASLPPLHDSPVFIACDLSATTDLTSLAAVYPVDGKFYVKSYNFVPRAAVQKREKMNLKDYGEFAYAGSLTITDGNAVDYGMIRDTIKRIPGRVQMVIFDKWNSLETSQLLAKEGYDVFNFPQFHSYFNEPTKKLEQLVKDRQLVHDGNLCLRWAINNCQLNVDPKGLVKPVKPSDYAKVDPVISLVMALSQALLHAGNMRPARSIYDEKPVMVF